MGLESSGREKTLHALNVDDMLLDKRDLEKPRGEGAQGGQKGGIEVGFQESTRGNSPQPPLKRMNMEPSSSRRESRG